METQTQEALVGCHPPFYGAGMGTDRTTVQRNIEKALKNGNFTFHSYDVTICFFFSLFHHLMEPLAASLWCTGASCDCGHDQLHLWAKRIASCTQDAM